MNGRERPWKVLRVVVEAKVPPTSRATEKDLQRLVEDWTPETTHLGTLRASERADARSARLRVKTWGKWWPVFRIMQKKAGLL